MTEEQSPDGGREEKRPGWRSLLGDLKVDWSLPGGLKVAGTGIIALLAIVLVGGFIVLYNTGTSIAGETHTEPVQTPGDNPFMPPAGTDRPGVSSPPRTGREFVGNTFGLYGGTLNNSTCDRRAMISFLQANPSKGVAWAEVQGINQADLSNYISRLTPMFLRSDTLVTNHGFSDRHATTLNSVLQAGTAVLVDTYGVPRARCYCGNPLTPPNPPATKHYVGPTWQGFSPTSTTTIKLAAAEITEFTLVNPSTNEIIYRPAGTEGDQDHVQVPEPSSQPVPPEPSQPQPAPPQPEQPETKCPHGYSFDKEEGECRKKPETKCPDGYSFDKEEGECRKKPEMKCPDGYSFDKEEGECRKKPEPPKQTETNCPHGYFPDEGGRCPGSHGG